ncbi:MAG: hypothetical protein IPJ87_16545 [Flavobacteriales bacterium]|nr:hypothetical protein [Flavobacteriales bacterium]MBK7943458.1 hypothetical protein [Flavobacteriales bacterium]MBK9699853.1 hypothetical protein [Flavobacteriales bacterium]
MKPKSGKYFDIINPANEQKLARIAEVDLPKEPHRNRLNVLMSRTNHLAYHRGQLIMLAEK